MKSLHWIALILTIMGALNWGLVGAFDFNLVTALFGNDNPLTRIVYIVVGLSGLVVAATSMALTSDARTTTDYGARPAVR